ncbi:PIG-L deacetylase family protein [Sulfitobacter faviae]|uniref:PIG-L deacetylase family protein n=1 Tax=Sulfitobacter faviae TaxID=1775881 RepID=UPI00398CC1EF
MNILIVVAHPDDEGLGAGGTIHRLAKAGHNVDCCILSGSVDARAQRPKSAELQEDIQTARRALGYRNVVLGDFPNIQFNTVPHLHLVQFIETHIEAFSSQVIFTHHPSDLNNDHTQTARACLAASRLWQRRENVPRLQELYFMEIQSSTEWAFPGHNVPFEANTFIELDESDIEAKIASVDAYRKVMRPVPHPRSSENMTALTRFRGSQAGYIYAEAFQRVFGGLNLTERGL